MERAIWAASFALFAPVALLVMLAVVALQAAERLAGRADP